MSLQAPGDVIGSEKQYGSGDKPSPPVAVVLLPCDLVIKGQSSGRATQRRERQLDIDLSKKQRWGNRRGRRGGGENRFLTGDFGCEQ